MRTFGFSFATKKDIDKNEYPDVAVGAFATSNAVVFKYDNIISLLVLLFILIYLIYLF